MIGKNSSINFRLIKTLLIDVIWKKPNKTQPNSPVISIINRSISALIRSTISDSYNLIRVDCSIDSREFNAYNL